MKKVFLLVILIMLFIKIPFLNAECKELKDFVNNEEFVFLNEIHEENPYIFIEVYNIFSSNVYVVIEENYNNTKVKYASADFIDNYLSMKNTDISRSTKYKIKIFGNIESCQDELLRTVEFNTTTKNQYYDTSVCIENRGMKGVAFLQTIKIRL